MSIFWLRFFTIFAFNMPAKPPDRPMGNLACDDTRNAIASAMLAQTTDERGGSVPIAQPWEAG